MPTTLRYAQGKLDAPAISDVEHHRLFLELQTLAAAHPELQSPDSPTLRVGAIATISLAKYTHRRPMLSLANALTPRSRDLIFSQ
jgi:DNA ligase (NAD+)